MFAIKKGCVACIKEENAKNYTPMFALIASRQFLFCVCVAASRCCFFIKLDGDQKAAFTHLETTRLIYLCATKMVTIEK